MMEQGFFPEEDIFLVEPFRQISELVIEKETDDTFVMEAFEILYNYFNDKKEYRTISDVDRVMKSINDVITKKFPDFDFSSEEKKEEQSQMFIDSFKNFVEKNEENINRTYEEKRFEPFLSHWIMNLNTSLEIFDETFELFIAKKHKILRSSSRAVEKLFDRVFDLVKAIFLVFFRIAEQIYMISNDIDLDVEKEIDYLLDDIVYLENIQRQSNSSFK